MLNIFTVAFFGHRDVLDSFSLEQQLEKETTKLISQKQYVEFLVGRNGEFDKIVSRVISFCGRMKGIRPYKVAVLP